MFFLLSLLAHFRYLLQSLDIVPPEDPECLQSERAGILKLWAEGQMVSEALTPVTAI